MTAFDIAQRFVGIREMKGPTSNPLILGMLQLDAAGIQDDETAWCSAFVNFACWLLRLPRSKSLAARSWLSVGSSVDLREARVGYDVVVLQRGEGKQPGPEVQAAPGHVGFYAGHDETLVWLLGGNQGDRVSIMPYNRGRVLGVRRLAA